MEYEASGVLCIFSEHSGGEMNVLSALNSLALKQYKTCVF